MENAFALLGKMVGNGINLGGNFFYGGSVVAFEDLADFFGWGSIYIKRFLGRMFFEGADGLLHGSLIPVVAKGSLDYTGVDTGVFIQKFTDPFGIEVATKR